MNWLKKAIYSRPIQRELFKHGYLLREDVIKNELLKPLKVKDQEYLSKELQLLNSSKDPVFLSKQISKINRAFEKAYSTLPEGAETKAISYLNNIGAVGYEAAGSVLKKLYPAPFQPYAFIADNYWAADKARGEIRIEIERNGYVLIAEERTSKKQIKAVNEILNQLEIPQLWTDWADTLNTFGNFWNRIHTNKLGGLKPGAIEMLLPERLIPVLDVWSENIIAWDYEEGGKSLRYSLDGLDHVMTYSTRSRQLGSPALTSMIVEIEADMQATFFNNTVMQKGGLIKGILSLAAPDGGDSINDQSYVEYADKIQQLINKKMSGVKGGGQLAAMFGIQDFFDLGKISDIDGIYQKSSDRTAARVSLLLGCPAERMGIRNYSQYQNIAQVTDSVALSMDNRIYMLTSKVADYINTEILQKRLGVHNIFIQESGEFNSVSKSAAEFGKIVSDMGSNVITVNEFRTKVLRWEPLEDEELGNSFLGSIKNEALLAKATQTPSGKSMRIDGKKFIKHRPSEIKYYTPS